MAGLRKWFLSVVFAICLHQTNSCEEACWEKCFQAYDTEAYRYHQVYDELLQIGLELTYLKNVYNVKKMAFLIDSALSSHFNQPENNNTVHIENGTLIYRFELLLGTTLALMVNGPVNYVIQYDEESAWTCGEFSCIPDGCTTFVAFFEGTEVEMTPTSHCLGNVEAACRLAQRQILDADCSVSPSDGTTMAIAITNGNFHINGHSGSESFSDEHHKCPPFRWGGLSSDSRSSSSSSSSSSSEEFFSPCHSYFDTRYVIGTHDSSREVMERFPSMHGNYRYLHATQYSYNALWSIFTCMMGNAGTNCCTNLAPIPVSGTTCVKTQGPYGENITPFPTHPATNPDHFLLNF